MTKQEFIQKIAGYVQKYAAQYGITVYSPIIAQAILESGWGESKLAAVYHNYFGLKCGTKWKGKSVNLTTQEEYQPGTLTTIKDNFRVFDSMEAGVQGYFEFIQLSRYQNLKGITDPRTYLEIIRADGYATSSTYVQNNMRLIEQYNLTQYDRKGDSMGKIEKAVQQMEAWAKDASHGYDQIYRWGEKGDFDCSAAVIQACENAGIPVKSNGATYTGNMLTVFKKCGFKDVTSQVTLSTGAGLIRGDVLLNTSHHTAMYCGDGKEVEASINEKGTATGGNPGDQTGKEFLIRAYRNYPWTNVLRYAEAGGNDTGKKTVAEVAKEVLSGAWGNGDARRTALTNAGYDYDTVQAAVNKLVKGQTVTPAKSVDEVAKEVINGKWGNGDDRKKKLIAAGYDYDKVQDKVNALLKKPTVDVTKIAKEVIAGKWGNGEERRSKLTAAGYDYDTIQKRVNELVKGS
ncbi:glucosaminidase domain-containing protein [Coprococcus comes]|uniref:glucosaminidase domain-containing protein n=1 Tax=Coprococcus comes TaxID=410072 RepID=UPI0018982E8B|nr:glucosaminidase domain-containing protein [Coprococcus comes]